MSHRDGEDVTVLTYGTLVNEAMKAAQLLENAGVRTAVIRLLEVSSPDVERIAEHLPEDGCLVILEEIKSNCGIRESISWQLRKLRPLCRIEGIDLGNGFVTHGSVSKLYSHCGLDAQSVANRILEVLGREDKKTAGCITD